MKVNTRLLRTQFALFLLICSIGWTSVGYAQRPSPEAPASPAPQASPTARFAGVAHDKNTPLPSTTPVPAAAAAAGENEKADLESSQTVESSVPLDPAFANTIKPAVSVQGIISLDVSVPDTVRAGDAIEYTYAYTNGGTTPATDIEIQALWTNFHPTSNGSAWQWCEPSIPHCGLLQESIVGPSVTPASLPSATTGMRFRIGELGPGQSGQFKVRLRSNANIFPQTGKQITRPAGSAKLFTSFNGQNSNTAMSEDTANTMAVGPVFVLTKAPVNAQPIYPGETVEFVIRVGNATAADDKINGQVRADAVNATNVVLRDRIPDGTELVQSNPAATSTSGGIITWNVGNLAVGETKEFHVVFRKLNQRISCSSVDNNQYSVTSAEMPNVGGTSQPVNGARASVGVKIPMVIKSITPIPGSKVFGDVAQLEIVVQNYWNQAITGAQLHYDIQTNAFYVPQSAFPATNSVPDSTQPGGRITWTFNMPAGNKTTPSETKFSLHVRGGYTREASGGVAQIIPPAEVPSACFETKSNRVNFTPRLEVTKSLEPSGAPLVNNVYHVQRGERLWYTITVANVGVADATDVQVEDLLPKEVGANFVYVRGSATVENDAREPNSISDGQGGMLIWNGITVPAKGKVVIRYQVVVDGIDYVEYCNYANLVLGSETIYYHNKRVCAKINPRIEVTKVSNKATARPGEEIEFTLTLTNREPTSYRVGLYDDLGDFIFVRHKDGYAEAQHNARWNEVSWPLIDLSPGQQITARFVAKAPEQCTNRVYENQALFHHETHIIEPIPRVVARVQVVCNQLAYQITADRSPISLQDRIVYTLALENLNPADAINSVTVESVLPAGFQYRGIEVSSLIKDAPKEQTPLPGGRLKLKWSIPSIAKAGKTNIRFIATSGATVGSYETWLTASAPDTVGICRGTCAADNDGTGDRTFSKHVVGVQTLITIAPEISASTCTAPGQTLTYRLQVVNANNHSYTKTNISAALPLGLSYVRPLNTTATPSVSTDADGITQVTWSNVTIPAKPSNAIAAQVLFEIEVRVGQVWGELATIEQAVSADGLIPRKDGAQNAVVLVCPSKPAVAKIASRPYVKYGETVLYQISLANPTNADVAVTVDDVLPAGLTYVSMARDNQPAPTVSGNQLRWSVTIPAAKDGKAGTLALQLRARVAPDAPPEVLRNVVRVTAAVSFDTRYNTADVVPFGNIHVPLARR